MDCSFEVFQGRKGNAYSQEATRKRVEWLCAQAKGNVLDVGCSQGLISWIVGHAGHKVTGIDIDVSAIAWAREHLAMASNNAQSNICFVNADFLSFFPKMKFDCILVGEYIEHLPDATLDAQLSHMADLLAPGGVLALTTPLGLHEHPDHEQIFYPSSLARKLAQYFSILEMDCEDAYLRVLCNLAMPRNSISPLRLLEISEKGILQLQQKAAAGKRAVKTAEFIALREKSPLKDEIDIFIRENPAPTSNNELANALAAKGLEAPFLYDRYLFKTLNAIYKDRPVVPLPREISQDGLMRQADRRVDYLDLHFNLAGASCLEIGCGGGETAQRIHERHGCKVLGVDAFPYPQWGLRKKSGLEFMRADLCAHNRLEPESYDFICSFSALEHMPQPLKMLEVIYELLKPGGTAYITANLYRGPKASHRYREVFFPWPHLLFDDDVFMRFYRDEFGKGGIGPVWVNKLTHLHYLRKIEELGFEIRRCGFSRLPFDEDFYNVFYEKLGKYPKEDLEIDFINLNLRKSFLDGK